MLVGLAGLPASGKTSVAKQLEKQGYVNLSRDLFLSSLFHPADFGSREQKDIAYKTMLGVSEYYLKNGQKVVLDCPSFSQTWAVKLAQQTARRTRKPFKLIYLTCPEDIAVQRIQRAKKHIATDRTTDLYFKVKKRFQPLKASHAVIRTDRALKDTMKDVKRYLESHK